MEYSKKIEMHESLLGLTVGALAFTAACKGSEDPTSRALLEVADRTVDGLMNWVLTAAHERMMIDFDSADEEEVEFLCHVQAFIKTMETGRAHRPCPSCFTSIEYKDEPQCTDEDCGWPHGETVDPMVWQY